MVKFLVGDDLDILQPIVLAMGWTELSKETTMAIAEMDGDTVIGFICLRRQPLVGPLWVYPSSRGRGIPEALVKQLLEFMASEGVNSFLTVADNPFSEALCEAHGMEKITSPVYIKKS